MGKALVAAATLLAFVAAFAIFLRTGDGLLSHTPAELSAASVYVGGTPVYVTIADTTDEHRRGFSGMSAPAPNEGMLFVFDRDDTYGIWMKDMLFPIDIMWISADQQIVDLRENVAPETYPEVFAPRTPARYVLEVPAGFIESYNIAIGDAVAF